MALKINIDEAAFKALDPKVQTEYKKGDDGYRLDLDGYEDPAALKRAKDHEKEQRKAAEKAAKDAADALTAITEERDNILRGAIPKADVEKLEGSYKAKLAKREQELTAELTAAQGTLQSLLVDSVAATIASKISTAPAIIAPHLKSRLRAEKNAEGKFVTKVVDAQGQPSALTVEELEKEFVLNKDFAPIITGSKGSGGGAGGSGSGGGAGTGKVNWSGSPKEIAASLAAQGKLRTA